MQLGLPAASVPRSLAQALADAFGTIRRTIPRVGDRCPIIGRPDLTYAFSGDNWVEGFWSGQLWLAYAETNDPIFFEAARRQRLYFAARLERPESHDHDLGFLYSLSAVADYKLTGNSEARRIGLEAASSLAKRYNPVGRFVRAWNAWSDDEGRLYRSNEGKIIIDCMENLGLLFWAADETGEARYREIAAAHATTAAHTLVRPDGSSYHAYDFNPASGERLGGSTHQGYSDDSCWSRGQGWGIHGFAQTYAYTRDPLFLETSRKLADYALEHLPDDKVPYWDYRLPEEVPHYRDTSAAAITAAGLFLLADQLGGDARAGVYCDTAQDILSSLAANYTTVHAPHAEGLLVQGASHVGIGLSDAMLPYGDYFYLEALLRARGRKDFFW